MAIIDKKIEKLNIELIRMGALCEDIIAASVKGFLTSDSELLDKAEALEAEINQQERDTEALCMRLILKQHPVARDLRVISSALKMISDMERIGDHAFEISELAKMIHDKDIAGKVHVREMSLTVIKMVSESIESFVKVDIELARKVIADDDIADTGFNTVKNEIVDILQDKSVNSEYAVNLLMLAKYLERIGDHAVNIAKWVCYSITGKHEHEHEIESEEN